MSCGGVMVAASRGGCGRGGSTTGKSTTGTMGVHVYTHCIGYMDSY